jgi:hypothetical protein
VLPEDYARPALDKTRLGQLIDPLREQQAEAAKLDAAIAKNLKDLGYEP